jgi:Rrf2 family protein
MRISTKGRYGLRTLMDVALHQAKGPVTLNDIAERQSISVKYLWQVINPLKTSGLLSVTRGAKGGYVLARRPEDITMLEVVNNLEGPMSVVECLTNEDACSRINSCISRTVWMEVNCAVEKALSAITLAEVLRRCANSSEVDNYVI